MTWFCVFVYPLAPFVSHHTKEECFSPFVHSSSEISDFTQVFLFAFTDGFDAQGSVSRSSLKTRGWNESSRSSDGWCHGDVPTGWGLVHLSSRTVLHCHNTLRANVIHPTGRSLMSHLCSACSSRVWQSYYACANCCRCPGSDNEHEIARIRNHFLFFHMCYIATCAWIRITRFYTLLWWLVQIQSLCAGSCSPKMPCIRLLVCFCLDSWRAGASRTFDRVVRRVSALLFIRNHFQIFTHFQHTRCLAICADRSSQPENSPPFDSMF